MPHTQQRDRLAADLALRSEELHEVITEVPRWIIRWGITVCFLVLVLLLAGSWVVHYPDLVTASVRLTDRNAPRVVRVKDAGILTRLLVGEGALVREGQPLAYLESTAQHGDVRAYRRQLDELARDPAGLATFRQHRYYRLGELQTAAQVFDAAYEQYMTFQPGGYHGTRRQMLLDDLAVMERMATNLRQQQQLLRHDGELAQQEFAMQQDLAQQHVIAPADLRREVGKLISRQLPAKQLEAALLQNQANQTTKRKELLDLEQLHAQQPAFFQQALHTIRSAVAGWENRYVLAAPLAGRVHFAARVEEKQPLGQQQQLFYISPAAQRLLGEAHVPQRSLGKLRPGQRVIVKFAGYPFQQFGSVAAQVSSISAVPTADGRFLVQLDFPAGLRTSTGRTLTYRAGLNGSADIVTQDLRLLERFFYGLREAVAR